MRRAVEQVLQPDVMGKVFVAIARRRKVGPDASDIGRQFLRRMPIRFPTQVAETLGPVLCLCVLDTGAVAHREFTQVVWIHCGADGASVGSADQLSHTQYGYACAIAMSHDGHAGE